MILHNMGYNRHTARDLSRALSGRIIPTMSSSFSHWEHLAKPWQDNAGVALMLL